MAGYGATDRGRRDHNEDGLVADGDLGLFVVADGMGGHNAGEVASALALDSIRTFIARSRQDYDHSWPFGVNTSLDYAANRLRTAVKLANRRVFRESENRNRYTGMGTTVAALLVDESTAVFCSVGDSRIYVVHPDGSVDRLTRDHSWIEALRAENPSADPSCFEKHPMRHVLTMAVGATDDLEVAIQRQSFADGDRFLLCTDGVYRTLGDTRMAAIVAEAPDLKTAAAQLVSAAADTSDDNVTAVVLGMES